jgi:hypothetical protein
MINEENYFPDRQSTTDNRHRITTSVNQALTITNNESPTVGDICEPGLHGPVFFVSAFCLLCFLDSTNDGVWLIYSANLATKYQ